MRHHIATHGSQDAVSPMILSDRLLTMAEDADRAGLRAAADKLVHLAHAVFESAGNA